MCIRDRKVTGMTLLDYLKQKLFIPMHITDVAWEISPEGINTGGWGLHIPVSYTHLDVYKRQIYYYE